MVMIDMMNNDDASLLLLLSMKMTIVIVMTVIVMVMLLKMLMIFPHSSLGRPIRSYIEAPTSLWMLMMMVRRVMMMMMTRMMMLISLVNEMMLWRLLIFFPLETRPSGGGMRIYKSLHMNHRHHIRITVLILSPSKFIKIVDIFMVLLFLL